MIDSIREILNDPSTSFWLRHALGESLQRDPLDAACDAEALARVLSARADESLYESLSMLVEEEEK